LSLFSACNVAGSLPGKLDLITWNISTLSLGVDTLDNVSVGEVPFTLSLWLVKSEGALEVGTVGISPLSVHEVAILETSNVLLSCLFEDVSTLSVLLSLSPVARVDVLVLVSHHAFSVTFTLLPVAVILTDILVCLFTDSALLIVFPGALICDIPTIF